MSRACRGLRCPRPHPTVGYGHSPEAHRFTKGQSGNPRGRPKGTTSRTPTRPPDRLATIVREEAARLISVREGERTVTLSMQQVIIRGLFVDAVQGDPRARRHVLEALALSEDEVPRTAEPPRRPFEIVIVNPKARQPDKDRRPEDTPAAGA